MGHSVREFCRRINQTSRIRDWAELGLSWDKPSHKSKHRPTDSDAGNYKWGYSYWQSHTLTHTHIDSYKHSFIHANAKGVIKS